MQSQIVGGAQVLGAKVTFHSQDVRFPRRGGILAAGLHEVEAVHSCGFHLEKSHTRDDYNVHVCVVT